MFNMLNQPTIKAEPRRLMMHSGKKGKNGVYSPAHNDEKEKYEKAEEVLTTWNMYGEDFTFTEAEQKFYEDMFLPGLESRNKKYKARGNKKAIKTIDEYRTSEKKAPTETLYGIGNMENSVSADVLCDVYVEYYKWHESKFKGHIQILDFAIHKEKGAPHIHERKVGYAKNKDGFYEVNMTQALNECGVQAPEPDKPITRYNCPLQTYTAMCRDKLQEICHSHGIELITEPKPSDEVGMNQEKYIQTQINKKMELTKEIEALENKKKELTAENEKLITENEELITENDKLEEQKEKNKRQLITSEKMLSAKENIEQEEQQKYKQGTAAYKLFSMAKK